MAIYPVLEKLDDYEYRWPDGIERFKAMYFLLKMPQEDVKVVVGITVREAYGSKRKRVVIFGKRLSYR